MHVGLTARMLGPHMQDGEIRKAFERSLKKQGFNFMLNTKVRPLLCSPSARPSQA